jgi:ATP-dependent protease ClpP protease subunit
MTNLKVEEQPQGPPEPKPYTFYETPLVSQKIFHFYISEAVGDADKYVELIHKIKTAAPTDVIYLYLNTPGGNLYTGIQIMSAMNNSDAHVITVLEGEVCSLGTMLFLCGDEFVVNDFSMFMIHNYSGGAGGKGHEIVAQVDASTVEFKKLFNKIYYPFLTREEIDRVIKGEDLWMGADEVRSRLDKMIKILEKTAREELKAEKAKAKN